MISCINTNSDCIECDMLLSRYESTTFELARIHNALDIAERMRDRQAIRKLTLEAYEVAERKRTARSALLRHQALHDAEVLELPVSSTISKMPLMR